MTFCDRCINPISSKNNDTISLLEKEYLKDTIPWVVGYSGGKDSSAVVKLVFNALLRIERRTRQVYIVYCDTGVEVPVISKMVKRTLSKLQREAKEYSLPIKVKIAKPDLEDSYFVKVIGRGYPPPTNIFRWCTDRLRIKPIHSLIRSIGPTCTVLLGVRKGESHERDRTLNRHATEEQFHFRQAGTGRLIFSPIINYNIRDVWSTLAYLQYPKSIDGKQLGQLYKDAGNECPVIKDTKGSPCGQGRFGCWTCTVVRKDKAVTSMVNEGYAELHPLLDFRNWLASIRDMEEHRCKYRRNGARSLGPFTLRARRLILKKLKIAERSSGLQLISETEITLIKNLWKLDMNSPTYQE